MTNKEFAEFLLPNVEHDFEYYENLFKERNLDDKAIVTRYAPSPTGLPHMGNMFQCFMSYCFAKQSNGVFFVRVEDTDTERTVENGISKILNILDVYNLKIDEGVVGENEEIGIYGPYTQSNRKDIYQAYARKLIEEDKAYPSFASKEELDEIREFQESTKQRLGYYGRYAKDRHMTKEEAIKRINNGEKYIIRMKSPGDFNKSVIVNDLIKGKIEIPENDIDEVIIKKDGLPTYHFAHVIDDHLMHVTHVIRGDEYVSSTPKHLQMFDLLGWKPVKYAHLSPLLKNDNGTKRKLSKRKDPEAGVVYYIEQGIPVEAVELYLATIINSNFEAWLDANPTGKIEDFTFDFKKVGSSGGAIYDMDKLTNISKNYLSRLSASDLYDRVLNWAISYDKDFYDLISKHKDYTINILNIEREQKKPRKDFAKYSDVYKQIWYMYDECFDGDLEYDFKNITDKSEIKNILNTYIGKYYDENDDKDTWFSKIKLLCDELGYASDMKAYKANPENYKGNVADVSTVIRVGLTTSSMTPDLYEILKLLGKDRIMGRIERLCK